MSGILRRSFTEAVTIARPVAEVYAFYADFANVPRIVGDVTEVRDLADGSYSWRVELPLGLHTSMRIVVEEKVPDRLLAYRTSGPAALRAHWLLEFAAAGAARTTVTETLSGPLGPPFGLLIALVGKHPRAEVRANLDRLKGELE